MSYVHRCMIVPAAQAELARELVYVLAGEPAAGMFTTGLSEDGDLPYTHFISTGHIEEQFGQVLGSAPTMAALCVNAGRQITALECTALLGACDITSEDPWAALARMNLKLLTAEQLVALQASKAAAVKQAVL